MKWRSLVASAAMPANLKDLSWKFFAKPSHTANLQRADGLVEGFL
jgi:hypothetical protein